jgi:hypothetical protein
MSDLSNVMVYACAVHGEWHTEALNIKKIVQSLNIHRMCNAANHITKQGQYVQSCIV